MRLLLPGGGGGGNAKCSHRLFWTVTEPKTGVPTEEWKARGLGGGKPVISSHTVRLSILEKLSIRLLPFLANSDVRLNAK